MIKIFTIIGARPQIIKSSAISRCIKNKFHDKIEEVILHTGQHYDYNMSEVFKKELELPDPKYNLNVGSAKHGDQTSQMIKGIEDALLIENPDCIIIYGDTNSTLAASIAASKIHIPIVHIEAGLRSFRKQMPEEINRILSDHCSTLLFSPTKVGFKNLLNEGFKKNNPLPFNINKPGIFKCGDIMYDNSLYFSKKANKLISTKFIKSIPKKFILATIHRNDNTDNIENLNSIFDSFNEISTKYDNNIIIPLHPRTSNILKSNLSQELYTKIINNPKIQIIKPVSFIEMIYLEKNCDLVLTDSGGVQKESYFFKKNCIILRSETEWVEIVQNGNGIISGSNKNNIINAYLYYKKNDISKFPKIYGNGNAAEFICEKIYENFS